MCGEYKVLVSCRCGFDSAARRIVAGIVYLQTNPVVVLARSANLSPETQASLTSAHKHKASPYPFFSHNRCDGEVIPEG